MAYVDIATLQTIAPGEVFTAATLQQIRDNQEFFIDPPACSVYNNAAVSLTSGTMTSMTANSENFDNDSMHSTSSNTSRITIQTAGRYLLVSSVKFAPNATGERLVKFLVDGTTSIDGFSVGPDPSASRDTNLSTVRAVVLTAGQYVEVQARQISGGDLNATLSEFAVLFLTR